MTTDARPPAQLGLSVAWGYAFALLLLAFILAILVPDADGPSPWDPVAFRQGMIEMIANFRILDELADLGVVKVADVGDGLLAVDLEQLAVSNRRFGSAPFYVALLAAALCLLVRALRFRILARHAGIPSSVRGQVAGYFFGRGLNLLFPFGPGELGTIRAVADSGGDRESASAAVLNDRLFELLAIAVFLLAGFVHLGWAGAIEPFVWAVVLVTTVASLTRPVAGGPGHALRRRVLGNVWEAFGGAALKPALAAQLRAPRFFLGVLLLSVLALGFEVLAFWSIKQAFSSPMDDYVLMKDLAAGPFTIVVAVAALARVIPYTVAGLGVVELVMVVMFRAFGEGFLTGATVALLCALLMNGTTFVFFQLAIWVGRCPSVLETWQTFFDHSAARAGGDALPVA